MHNLDRHRILSGPEGNVYCALEMCCAFAMRVYTPKQIDVPDLIVFRYSVESKSAVT